MTGMSLKVKLKDQWQEELVEADLQSSMTTDLFLKRYQL